MDKRNNLTKGSRIYLAILLVLFTGCYLYGHQFSIEDWLQFIFAILWAFIKFFFGALIISSILVFPFKSTKMQVPIFNGVLTVIFLVSCFYALQ